MSDPGRHVIGGYLFAPIPEWVLYHPDLSDKAVRIFGALLRHGVDPHHCYPSDARLAQLINCAEGTIPKHRKQLYVVGAVVSFPRFDADGRQTTNGYRLAGDAPLVTPATQQGQPAGYPTPLSTQQGERELHRTTGTHPQTTSTCGDSGKPDNTHVAQRARDACDLIGDHLHAQAVKKGIVASPPAHLVSCRQHAAREHHDRAERLAYTYPEMNAQQLARMLYGGELRSVDALDDMTQEDIEAVYPNADKVDVKALIQQAKDNLRGT